MMSQADTHGWQPEMAVLIVGLTPELIGFATFGKEKKEKRKKGTMVYK